MVYIMERRSSRRSLVSHADRTLQSSRCLALVTRTIGTLVSEEDGSPSGIREEEHVLTYMTMD